MRCSKPIVVAICVCQVLACGEPSGRDTRRSSSTPAQGKAAPKQDDSWRCRKFSGELYDPEKIQRVCEYVDELHGQRPRTRGSCEQLATLVQDVSVPVHNCDEMQCIQVVADEIGLERFPDCAELPTM